MGSTPGLGYVLSLGNSNVHWRPVTYTGTSMRPVLGYGMENSRLVYEDQVHVVSNTRYIRRHGLPTQGHDARVHNLAQQAIARVFLTIDAAASGGWGFEFKNA